MTELDDSQPVVKKKLTGVDELLLGSLPSLLLRDLRLDLGNLCEHICQPCVQHHSGRKLCAARTPHLSFIVMTYKLRWLGLNDKLLLLQILQALMLAKCSDVDVNLALAALTLI